MIKPDLHFEKNVTYFLDVVLVHEKRRHFQAAGGVTKYTHDIYFQDKDGKKYKGEYVNLELTQDVFTVGKPARVRCEYVSSMGEEIVPVGHQADWDKDRYGASNSPAPVSQADSFSPQQISFNIKVAALQAAVTIKAAQIAAFGTNPDDPDFQKSIFDLAGNCETYLNA